MIRFCLNADTHLENNQLCFLLNFLFTFPSLENMLSLHPIVKTRAALENTSPNDLLYFSTIFPQHSTLQLYSSLCLPAVFALKVLVGVFSCLSSSITSTLYFISHRFVSCSFCHVCPVSATGDTSAFRNFPLLTFGDVSHIFTNSQNSLRFKKFLVTRSLGMFLPPRESRGSWTSGQVGRFSH